MIPERVSLDRNPRSGFASLLLVLAACGSSPAANVIVPDAGDGGMAGAADSADAASGTASSPYDTPSMCSSDAHWTKGNQESPQMHPGGACITCHSKGEGPKFSLAGTVFPTAHEPIDCNGVEGANDVHVVVTDAAGTVLTLSVNAAGNFYSTKPIVYPFHAKVVTAGQERAMGIAQMTGDCNSCHTENGANGAPGRIMLP